MKAPLLSTFILMFFQPTYDTTHTEKGYISQHTSGNTSPATTRTTKSSRNTVECHHHTKAAMDATKSTLARLALKDFKKNFPLPVYTSWKYDFWEAQGKSQNYNKKNHCYFFSFRRLRTKLQGKTSK